MHGGVQQTEAADGNNGSPAAVLDSRVDDNVASDY